MEDITSYRYYTKRADHTYSLIYDRVNPVESVANLFTAYPDSMIKIEITQRMYGGKRELFTVPLTDFISFVGKMVVRYSLVLRDRTKILWQERP